MRILGIDTSSELSSVALVDGDSVITREVLDGRRHAEVLAVLLRRLRGLLPGHRSFDPLGRRQE